MHHDQSELLTRCGAWQVVNHVSPEAFLRMLEADPMKNDVYDPDEITNCRCEKLNTPTFGTLFARCAGDPLDPLILYLHGSGPHVSGHMWNTLMRDLQAMSSSKL